jgi:hypothetical protein
MRSPASEPRYTTQLPIQASWTDRGRTIGLSTDLPRELRIGLHAIAHPSRALTIPFMSTPAPGALAPWRQMSRPPRAFINGRHACERERPAATGQRSQPMGSASFVVLFGVRLEAHPESHQQRSRPNSRHTLHALKCCPKRPEASPYFSAPRSPCARYLRGITLGKTTADVPRFRSHDERDLQLVHSRPGLRVGQRAVAGGPAQASP